MLEKYKVPLIIVGSVLVLVIVGWVANSFPRQSILDEYVKNESARIIQQYEADMKAKDEKISFLTDRITASEKLLIEINKTVKNLEVKKQNVTKPNTVEETKERLNSLGYPTIK